jgi:DNA-binding transcriptional MerR regulator
MRTVAVQANPTMQTCLMQIGDVADRTGLSLRTIRHYEEVGLLPEAQRSAGGFRLYTEDAVARLLLIKRMKPLEFSLEEMRDLIETRDRLVGPRLDEGTRNSLLERLATYQSLVERKLAVLRERVDNAQSFADQLRDDMAANPHHP